MGKQSSLAMGCSPSKTPGRPEFNFPNNAPPTIGTKVHCTQDGEGNIAHHFGGSNSEFWEGEVLQVETARAAHMILVKFSLANNKAMPDLSTEKKYTEAWIDAKHVYPEGQAPQAVVADPNANLPQDTKEEDDG